jgi:hypothetical protein
MTRDQVEQQIRCCTDELAQLPTPFDSEAALEIGRFQFETRNDLATVAPRSSPTRLSSFQKCDIGAGLCGV